MYNKDNELITFSDISECGEVVNFYDLRDKKLTKINVEHYKERGKIGVERNRAIITFKEECSLFHTFIDSDSRVVAQKRGSFQRESPTPISKIYSTNEEDIESFTIDSNLVQNWIKKL